MHTLSFLSTALLPVDLVKDYWQTILIMSQKLSKDDVKKLFKQFDNGNGHLSLAELDRACIHFYPQLASNKKVIMRAYKAADSSGNGMIELREFEKVLGLLNHYNHLSELFQQLDTNGDHRISYNEFKKGFELMGEDSSNDKQIRHEFEKIDTNHGGFILFDEFCIYMAQRKLE